MSNEQPKLFKCMSCGYKKVDAMASPKNTALCIDCTEEENDAARAQQWDYIEGIEQ